MHIDLVASQANYVMSTPTTSAESSGVKLRYAVTLHRESNTLAFSTGGELRDSVLVLQLLPKSDAMFLGHPHIGRMRIPVVPVGSTANWTPPLVELTAEIPDNQFNVLFSEATHQRMPAVISVEVLPITESDAFDVDCMWNLSNAIDDLTIRSLLFGSVLAKTSP